MDGHKGSVNTPVVRMRSPAESVGYKTPGNGSFVWLKADWSGIMKGTIFSSIFTLLTTCIGAGTLSLPYAFEQVGITHYAIMTM